MNLKLLVLRSPQVKAVVDFYSLLGLQFVEEKHGEGPTHYAAEIGGMVLEIYPGKKASDVRLGFDVPCEIRERIPQECIIKEDPLIVRDPDGRLVELELA